MEISLRDVSLHLKTARKNKINNISKANKLANFASRFIGDSFVALDKINLNLNTGDRVAVIGPNGAGKSTLLRLMAGIYAPTYGVASIPKYALPLLDKSILTNELLGATSACKAHYYYVKARYGQLKNDNDNVDDFVKKVLEFAELEAVKDTPIIQYSDGMKARLIFSLYTSAIYPFMVVDEALGTTDAYFANKATKRFDDFVNSSSIFLLASHSEDLLRKYCNKGILLTNGRIIYRGSLNEVLNKYKNL